ncbi:SAM-dependent methyltransferase [Clostridium sp. 'deep sea']|nr:SAM-dependent methyltransferase [Clostridium sp. 'deep sea']
MMPKCESMADICSDHAFLPIYLVQNNICKNAIAGDIAKGPCEQGERQVKKYQLSNNIEVRCGSGLTVLRKKEVNGVVIAGVGGATIIEIFDNRREIVSTLDFLVLQPQNAYGALREYLAHNGFSVINESLVIENDIVYQILLVKKGKMKINSWLEAEYGKINILSKSAELHYLLNLDLKHYKKVLNQLKSAKTTTLYDKISHIMAIIEDIEKLLSDMK